MNPISSPLKNDNQDLLRTVASATGETAGAPSEKVEDASRRRIGTALLGLLGVGVGSSILTGCMAQDGEAPPEELDNEIGQTSQAIVDVLNYAALKAVKTIPGGPGSISFIVRGATSDGDGGQGLFIWDSDFQYISNAAGEDGGTVLRPTDRATGNLGRWRRVYSGAVSVAWFQQDTTGATNSTAAFKSAWDAAGTGGTIFIPRGTYSLDPDTHTPLWWARRWVGEAMHPVSANGTVIRPFSAGNILVNVNNSAAEIENIRFDGNNQVNICLNLEAAHNSRLNNVIVQNALQYGLRIHGAANALVDHVRAEHCTTGMVFLGCNGSTVLAPRGAFCTGPGMEIVGSAATSLPTTPLASALTVVGAVFDACGSSGTSPAVLVRGLEGGSIEISRVEVSTNTTDALWVDENTHNVRFVGMRFVPGMGTSNVLARVKSAYSCSFSDFAFSGETATQNRIILTAANSKELDFFHCYSSSAMTADLTALVWENGGSTWTAYSRNGRLQAPSPPTLGTWQFGQVVENSAPAVDSPVGWVFIAPGAWRALANLT